MNKRLSDYIDSYGLIGVKHPAIGLEGGDTAANEGTYWYVQAVLAESSGRSEAAYRVRNSLELSISTLMENGTGKLVRHPHPFMWYSRSNTFSRDQLMPLLFALSVTQSRWLLKYIFNHHRKNYLLTAWNTRKNWMYPTYKTHRLAQERGYIGSGVHWDYGWKMPDFTGPEVWATWIRALRVWWLYPLLYVLDLETLLNSVIKHVVFYLPSVPQHKDHRNHILAVDHGNRVMPTFVMRLARWIYGKKIGTVAVRQHFSPMKQPPLDVELDILMSNWR